MVKCYRKLFGVIAVLFCVNAYAYEDPSTFTVGGVNAAQISTTSTRMTHTSLQDGHDAYGYKSYGDDYFGDFEIRFTVHSEAHQSNSRVVYFALSDTPDANQGEMNTANDGIIVFGGEQGTDRWYLKDLSNDNENAFAQAFTAPFTHYIKLTRSGTTTTLNVYSDSGFTTHVTGSPISVTSTTNKFRYLYMCASWKDTNLASTATGYVENVDIISADGDGGGEEEPASRRVIIISKSDYEKDQTNAFYKANRDLYFRFIDS